VLVRWKGRLNYQLDCKNPRAAATTLATTSSNLYPINPGRLDIEEKESSLAGKSENFVNISPDWSY
jgi:hypothetical protein